MKTILYILFILCILFIVIGWFLDWYDITGERNLDGQPRLQIDFDTKKIYSDWKQAMEKLDEALSKLNEDQEKQSIPAAGVGNLPLVKDAE